MTMNEQRTVGAVCVLPLFFKILDWMRLFESTTFFVGLMTRTIWSIRYFSLILLTWMLMFATSFYILD